MEKKSKAISTSQLCILDRSFIGGFLLNISFMNLLTTSLAVVDRQLPCSFTMVITNCFPSHTVQYVRSSPVERYSKKSRTWPKLKLSRGLSCNLQNANHRFVAVFMTRTVDCLHELFAMCSATLGDMFWVHNTQHTNELKLVLGVELGTDCWIPG